MEALHLCPTEDLAQRLSSLAELELIQGIVEELPGGEHRQDQRRPSALCANSTRWPGRSSCSTPFFQLTVNTSL